MRKKLLLGIKIFDWIVGISIIVLHTIKIDFMSITPHFDKWLMLIMLFPYTVILSGAPVWILSCILVSILLPRVEWSNQEIINAEVTIFRALAVAGAYSSILYLFGLTDTFFIFPLP